MTHKEKLAITLLGQKIAVNSMVLDKNRRISKGQTPNELAERIDMSLELISLFYSVYPDGDGEDVVQELQLIINELTNLVTGYMPEESILMYSVQALPKWNIASNITVVSTTGGGGYVISVNGKTGVVVLTKADVDLGRVDDTSDLEKPISDATRDALDLKANDSSISTVGKTGQFSDLVGIPNLVNTVAGRSGNVTLNRADVGLDEVNNTSDLNKPVSIATNTAITNLSNISEKLANKNVPNGYAGLDGSGLVPISLLPDAVFGQLQYQGQWDASTNTPTLPDATTVKGHFYVVSVGGTQFGHNYAIGDWAISDGISWDVVKNSDAVTSVFGRIGNIVANESDYATFYQLKEDQRLSTTNDVVFRGLRAVQNLSIPVGAPVSPVSGQAYIFWEEGVEPNDPPIITRLGDLLDVNTAGGTDTFMYKKADGTFAFKDVVLPTGEVYTKIEMNDILAGVTPRTGYNKSNWDTAYGWGNPAGVYLPLSGGNVTGNVTWTGQNSGNARSVRFGYSGGAYGSLGYGINFGNFDTYAMDASVTKIVLQQGIDVYWAASGVAGNAVSWTNLFKATQAALTYKGQNILYAGNYASLLDSRYAMLTGADFTGRLNSSYDITSSGGQGRFGGWNTGSGFAGPAVEIGYYNDQGVIIAYNRNTSAYRPIAIGGTNIRLYSTTSEHEIYSVSGGWNVTGQLTSPTIRATNGLIIPIGEPSSPQSGVFYLYAEGI